MRSLRVVVFTLFSLSTLVVLAQQPAPSADLRIVKTYRPSPPAFIVTVTNHGPSTAAGPVTITDSLPNPLQFASTQSGTTGWNCPATPWGAAVTCSRPGPLAPGNSATIILAVNPGTLRTAVMNCASVSAGPAGPPDPNGENNRDCACIDVNPCRDVRIDLTTGRENGQNLPPGAKDLEWQFVSGSTATPTTAVNSPWTPTAFGTPGTFITHAATSSGTAQPVPASPPTYRYDIRFDLAPTWGPKQCRLNIRFAGDNHVAFQLNNGPVFAQTPANLNPPTLAWTQLTNGSVNLPGGGAYTLSAIITNGGPNLTAGPAGLYVTGEVVCTCRTATTLENPEHL